MIMHSDSIVTISPTQTSDCPAIMNNGVKTREIKLYHYCVTYATTTFKSKQL